VSGLALRPIPAPDAERLDRLYPLDAVGRRGTVFSRAEYELLRGRAAGVQELVAYIPRTVTTRATRGGSPREILAYSVTGNYFAALGAASAQGRLLAPIDDTPGATPVAVISYRMWTERGGGADVVGATLLLNGATFTIVGVAPRSFVGTEPLAPDVWVPLSASAPDARDESPVLLLCRLRPGVASELVEAQLSPIVRNESRGNPEERRRSGLVTRRATFFPVERDPLAVGALVLLATGLLLAAAAANVSNLVLAQGLARRREIAVRLALGAGRARVAGQLILEVLCLTSAAAALALLLSSWMLSIGSAAAIARLPFEWGTVLLDVSPDRYVFAYTLAVCLLLTAGVGLAPVLDANRISLTSALRAMPAVFGARSRGWHVRSILAAAQVAVSLALAIVAGLLARAAVRADSLELGFEPRGVFVTTYDLTRHAYGARRAAAFNTEFRARASTVRGVTATALASHVPLTGGLRTTRIWSPEAGEATARPYIRYVYVSDGYFRTLGIRLVAGRDVAPATSGTVHEAVVSEVLSRRLWPDGPGVGMRLRTALSTVEYTVVGIARDTRASSLWRDKEAAVYLAADSDAALADTRLVALTAGSGDGATAGLGRIAQALEPEAAVAVIPLARAVSLWVLPSRAAGAAGTAIALLALLIASLGLYAVLAHLLAQQTREFGIRMALGAGAPDIVRLGLRYSWRLIAPGVATGLVLALLIAQAIAAFLFDISPTDPLTYGVVTLVASGSAVGACLFPALRATRVEPMSVLRTE
jgi:predicted permease